MATDGFGGFVLSVFAAIAYMIAVSAAAFVSYKAMMLSLANIDETAEKWNAALVAASKRSSQILQRGHQSGHLARLKQK